MSEAETDTTPGLLRAELPYVIMLLGAFIGVALNNFSGGPTILYWQLLAPAYGLICIFAGWRQDDPSADRMRLVRTQAIHWLACFIAMRLLFLPQIRGVLNDNATGLALLVVLALSTFLAGLHANAWRIAVVGVLLALSAPAAAWVEQSALLLSMEAILILGVGALFFWIRAKLRT
jgi:hypothetical protein